jgi:hypothetical protein
MLVGDFFENHLVERRMVSNPPERSLEAGEDPPTEYRMGFVYIPQTIFARTSFSG